MKRIAGVIVLVLGACMIWGSMYIQKQVDEGKIQISSAEKKVEQGNQLFSLNPIAKEVGKGLSGSAEKKIDAGKQEVQKYEQMASWLKIGGIAVGALGILIILFGRKRQK